MNEQQKQRLVAVVALVLAALILQSLWGCGSTTRSTCGDLCIYYDHDRNFADNMRRFPVELRQEPWGLMVYIQGSPYAADWIVNDTPAWGPLSIDPADIDRIEIIDPIKTHAIPGEWGEGGVVRVYTEPCMGTVTEQSRTH